MIVKTKEFIGALRATALFASADVTRTPIHRILIEPIGNALRLVSTDGHTLWACEIPAREDSSDPAPIERGPTSLSPTDVPKVLAVLAGAGVEVTLLGKNIGGQLFEPPEGDAFPYFAVVPNVHAMSAGKILPVFAGEYLARAAKAFAEYGTGFAPEIPPKGTKQQKKDARESREQYKSPPLALLVAGELDPAIVYSPKFPAAMAVVMPRRGDGGVSGACIAPFTDRLRLRVKAPTIMSKPEAAHAAE